MKKLIATFAATAAVAASANAAITMLPDGNRNADPNSTTFGTQFSSMAIGDSFYLQTTITNTSSASFAGLGAISANGEEIFLGRPFNQNIGVGQNVGSVVTHDVSTTAPATGALTIVLKATRGATAATDSFTYWIGADLSKTEAENSGAIAGTGTLTQGNITDITSFDYIAANNTPTWSNTQIFTQGDSAFAAVPEPSSTALLGLGGLALILRRRK